MISTLVATGRESVYFKYRQGVIKTAEKDFSAALEQPWKSPGFSLRRNEVR
jgi:hypothetical protein